MAQREAVYIATRKIIPYVHISGNEYTIDFDNDLASMNEIIRMRRKVTRSISNLNMLTFEHRAEQWRCVTIPLGPSRYYYYREFLASVEDQFFQFSPGQEYDYLGQTYKDAVLVSKRPERRVRAPVDLFVYDFTVEAVVGVTA